LVKKHYQGRVAAKKVPRNAAGKEAKRNRRLPATTSSGIPFDDANF
jgi:hypothetical protein